MIETGSLDHLGGNIAAKVRDLFSNVTKESVAGPATQEHDGVDRDMVEIHCHGGRGPTRVQADVVGGDAKALVVDGADVGPEELKGNGTGQIPNVSGGGHVGVDEGVRGCIESLESTDDGSGGFDRAEGGMLCSRLGNSVITSVFLLPFEVNSHFVR